MENQLLLPAPYGIGQKAVHISIRAPRARHDEVEDIALWMKCPPNVAKRVNNSIKYSGRYDCLVNQGVDTLELRNLLFNIGGSLECCDLGEGRFPHNERWSESGLTSQHIAKEWLRRNPLGDLLVAILSNGSSRVIELDVR